MKKIKQDLKQQPDVAETGLIYISEPGEIIEIKEIDKYQRLIDGAKIGNIKGLWCVEDILNLIKIIRTKTGYNMPVEWNCDACLIQIILKYNDLLK